MPHSEQILTPVNKPVTEGSVTSISILPYSPLVASVSVSPILSSAKPSAFATSPVSKHSISAISLEQYSPLVSPIRARSDSCVSTDGNYERRYLQQDGMKNKSVEVVSLQPFSPLAQAASPKSPCDPAAVYGRSNSVFPSISSEISMINKRPDGSSTVFPFFIILLMIESYAFFNSN